MHVQNKGRNADYVNGILAYIEVPHVDNDSPPFFHRL